MSGYVRRVLIWASIEGIVLHSHGHLEDKRSLLIDYKSQQISQRTKDHPDHEQHAPRLEAYGLIGFINIASSSYLIAITKREEVARIFGKPVYLVTDIVVLPLNSQHDANETIKSSLGQLDHASDDSDSNPSDPEDISSSRKASIGELSTTPASEIRPYRGKNTSSSSVAEDVATRNVPFGRFATQWLSRQRWTDNKDTRDETSLPSSEPKPASKDDNVLGDLASAANKKDEANVEAPSAQQSSHTTQSAATTSLLPRILRTIKLIFTSGSYFFSYDIDLTRRFEKLGTKEPSLNLSNIDPTYFWNRNLGAKFMDGEIGDFLTPVLQGFVGQKAFMLSKRSSTGGSEVEVKEVSEHSHELPNDAQTKSFLLTLISRRSTNRSGLRYLRRGIDDAGNVANFVETEQILSAADWNPETPIRSFVQVRGSIPLYFSQSPYSFKPAVSFQNSQQLNEKSYNKHFQRLRQQYGTIQVALLVDRHATEKPIGEAFERMYQKSKDENKADNITFEWFDFHSECRGMKFENVSRLVSKLDPFLVASSETVLQNGKVVSRQTGVIRTNCMDCLDRTNVAQSAFAQNMLQRCLEAEGYPIDFVTDPTTNWFNLLWADNGDAISRQYASTAALKGDYTRTRKRNWRGAMNDFGLTISRYYSNMVNDFFSQAVIDVLLGNVSWKVFEDFESKMMSADPGISVQSVREAAIDTCSKIVIQDPEKEDLIHAWTMLVPSQENTLRTLPFEEAVVLLTDVAIYCCKMDWSTEKVARYEKVDLRNIRKLKWGVYVTSTFTERQTDEDDNQGLVLYYAPGQGDIVRVNTRSLQNYHVPEDGEQRGVDGGTGILSWVAASVSKPSAAPERIMALKAVPSTDNDIPNSTKTSNASQIAEGAADQIRRAITGSTEHGEQMGSELVEHGDIISVAEAKKRTGYLEQVSHSFKKLVWA